MASSGKKGKKSKGTAISLQSFLADGDIPAGTTQVTKKVRNVDGDDSDDGHNALPLVYQLPTAPRANRIFDDESIPHKPPYMAYITNLPFDVSEDDIYGFFGNMNILSLRLPREDGETGRVRGFGYVVFESREDLIDILSLPDPSIKGRRIRIEVSNENEFHNKNRSNRRGFEGFNNSSEGRDSTNWRQDSVISGNNYDRGFNRERRSAHEDSEPGSWRTGNRPLSTDFSPKRDRSKERHRDFVGRSRNFERNEQDKSTNDETAERPKLHLKPRTLPLPEIIAKPEDDDGNAQNLSVEKNEITKLIKPSGVPSEKVFGSAKPVDTAAREMVIEERLEELRRQERIRRETDENDVSTKLSSIHLEKTDKENANTAISWRRNNDLDTNRKFDSRKHSPDRKNFNPDKDTKPRDRNERTEHVKHKKEAKIERSIPKHQPNQSEPILQSSNKYFGLDDEASE